MAITQAMCTSFKKELLSAEHNFNAAGGHTFNLALYTQAAASLSAATTVYTTTGELATADGYTQGGKALTNVNPSSSSTTALTDFSADLEWTSSTITSDGCMIYNTSATNKAVSVHTFTSASSVAGTFTVAMPDADASNAILRLA